MTDTWEGRPRGFCVFELEHTMLEQPSINELAKRFGLEQALRWAHSTSRTGSVDEARRCVQAFAGIPLQTAQKTCSNVRFRPGASDAVVAARAAGLAVILLATGPRQIAQQLGQRIGIDDVAGWEPEVSYGRFSGRMERLPWQGGCGQAVCGEHVVQEMRRRHGRPAVVVSAVPECMFKAADLGIGVELRRADAITAASLEDVPRLIQARVSRGQLVDA